MSEDVSEQGTDVPSSAAKGPIGRRSGILGWFSHPWVGVLGTAAGIVGMVLTVLFYFAAVRTPQLVFYPYPVKSTVVKSQASSQLRVLYRDREIGTDVTAVQVALWNNGRGSIRPENVLRPVRIVAHPPVPILEATIRKVTRDVTELKLDDCGFSRGLVCVNWRILEHADGGAMQIIYAGSQQVELALDGVIEGQPRILNVRYPGKIQDPTAQVSALLLPWWFMLAGIGAFGLAMPLTFLMMLKLTEKFRGQHPWRGFFAYVGGSLLSTGAIWLVLRLFAAVVSLPSPPFSF